MSLNKKINIIRKIIANEIPLKYLFNKDVYFPHPVGIVISNEVDIGKNVIIFSNVTIGGKRDKSGFPKIEDNVIIYSGAIVIGKITIGENSVIGANSVIVNDVPPNSVIYNKRENIYKENHSDLLKK